jgi:hypothetical protein
MPAFGTPDSARRAGKSLSSGQIFFTPASADPRLAALIARSGIGTAPFRFTPAESRGSRRPVTALQIEAPKAGVVTLRGNNSAPSVGVAPIAYNLVGTTAAKRLTVPGDALKMDLGTSPSGRRLDPGFNLAGRRPSKLKAVTDRPEPNARLAGDMSNVIDVGGAYSLRRNIDVTAGVRYKALDRDRLAPLPDDRRDSQAVYVGTTFKF